MNGSIQHLVDGEMMVEANGIKHWVRIAGSENATVPLVVLHGGPGGNHYNFERTIGPLLESFSTVIYFEQRGCGRSEAPVDETAYSIPLLTSDLEEIRNALNLDKIIPLGYSFGGELALEYAVAYPDSCEKVILESPSTGNWARQYQVQLWGFETIAEGDLKLQIRNLIESKEPLHERYSKLWNMVDTEMVDRFLFINAEAARLNRRMWAESKLKNTGLMAKAIFNDVKNYSLIDRVSSITIPVIALVGLHDRNIGLEVVRDLLYNIPNSRLVIFENSAHFPDMEEPEKFAHTVKHYLHT